MLDMLDSPNPDSLREPQRARMASSTPSRSEIRLWDLWAVSRMQRFTSTLHRSACGRTHVDRPTYSDGTIRKGTAAMLERCIW